MTDINPSELEKEVRRALHEHWQLFAIQGAVFVILGLAAIALPHIATLAVTAVIGWVFFIAGVSRLISIVRSPHAPGYASSILLAIAMAALGLILALFPLQGEQTLTYALIAYFIIHGAASIRLALTVRHETGNWIMMFVGGIVDFILAIVIFTQLPLSATWVLGLYVGISMVITGGAFVAAALNARRA